jgi:hypothetical protein
MCRSTAIRRSYVVAAFVGCLSLAGCLPGGSSRDDGNNGNGGNNGAQDTGTDVEDSGVGAACDFESVDNMVVIEAESLPINEDWQVMSEFEGYTGDGYLGWAGQDHFNDPTNGVMQVDVRINTPGRYQIQWHARIGKGDDPTEHNDTWVRFPDADDYYGLKGEDGAEIRRYARPQCEDTAFIESVESMPDVESATCPEGSTRDGWMKVYSIGATDWKWTGRTSDNDASEVMAEFGEAGVYTLEFAARSEVHLMDRIVLHEESIGQDTFGDLSLPETACE